MFIYWEIRRIAANLLVASGITITWTDSHWTSQEFLVGGCQKIQHRDESARSTSTSVAAGCGTLSTANIRTTATAVAQRPTGSQQAKKAHGMRVGEVICPCSLANLVKEDPALPIDFIYITVASLKPSLLCWVQSRDLAVECKIDF